MALSYVTYAGDGATVNFTYDKGYISTNDISVYLDGVLQTYATDWNWFNTTTIQFTVAPASAAVVRIQRATDRQTRVIDFQDAANLTEADLDTSALQTFYIAQEAFDDFTDKALSLATDNTFDAADKIIKNIPTPTADKHASNKKYVDDQVAAAVGLTEAVADTLYQPLDTDLSAIAALAPTKGRLIVGNGSAWVDLGVGTDGQVIEADSADAKGVAWKTPAAGGSWTFLEEIDLSSGSSKTTTTIPAHTEILVVFNQLSHSSASAARLDVTLNGTVTYEGQGVNYGGSSINWATTSSINAYTLPGASLFEGRIHFEKWDTRNWYSVEATMWSGSLSGCRAGAGTVKVTAGTFNTLTFAPSAGAFDSGTLQIFYK